MFGGGQKRALVGLDIGSSSIKAVELKSSKQGYELMSFGLEALAQDTVVDGAIMDAPLVAGAISNIFETQKIKTKNVATAVSGHSVIVKRVTLPSMTEEELYDRIQSEASQYTDALQKELDLSYEDAERLKKGENIAGVAEEHRGTILRSVTDILVLEIQKTFDFFRATATGESIQKIVVAGGSSRVPGLMDVLREEFAVPVEEMYPFRKIVINPARHNEDQIRELAPRLAIAVGLALRSFDEQ